MGDALEVLDGSALTEGRFLRMLIMGAPHVGKTACVCVTAPKPVYFINCDSDTSLNPGIELMLEKGQSPKQIKHSMVWSEQKMDEAIRLAREMVRGGQAKTICFDTLSSYSEYLLEQCVRASAEAAQSKKPDGRKYWYEHNKRIHQTVARLHKIQAHVITCSHFGAGPGAEDDETEDGKPKIPKAGEGIVPGVQGSARLTIGKLFDDIVYLDRRGDERLFKTDSQGVWGPNCKSFRAAKEIPADIGAFLKSKEERMKKLIAKTRTTSK